MTQELIAKLESASEGSRELDAVIAALDGWCLHPRTTYECVQSDSGRTCDDCGANSWGSRSSNAHAQHLSDPCPAYTTSIDAALALAERVLPGWWPGVSQVGKNKWSADIYDTTDIRPLTPYHAPKPALALCITLLRASAAEGAEA